MPTNDFGDAESVDCSKNTFFAGDPVFLFSYSEAPRVKGNEPGVGDGSATSGVDERGNGGIKSGIHRGMVWATEHAAHGYVNGIQVARHLDEVMSHASCGRHHASDAQHDLREPVRPE